MSLTRHKAEWEDLARLDPYWAILSYDKSRHGRWNLKEFLGTGEKEVRELVADAKAIGYPLRREVVLDFGCGVGRVTGPLSRHFRLCYGVDVSNVMIQKARDLNRARVNCIFMANSGNDLRMFPDSRFDMIYSNLVLQHLPRRSMIENYIREFVRTLGIGGLLVFQLPSYIRPLYRLQLRRRLYVMLRLLGLNSSFLYHKLELYPVRMNFIAAERVKNLLQETGAEVLRVRLYDIPSFRSCVYYATKLPISSS